MDGGVCSKIQVSEFIKSHRQDVEQTPSHSRSTRVLSIAELRNLARRRLPNFAWDFLESGAEDELSLHWNREIFRHIRFVPRTLVDTGERRTTVKLFGSDYASPLIIAPMGHCGIMRRDADLALARAGSSENIPFTLSTLSNASLEAAARAASGELWMQLYVFNDNGLTFNILERAERAGYEALVFTTDANVFGWRERDRRHFRTPGHLTLRSLLDVPLHPGWALDVLFPRGVPRLQNVVDFLPPDSRDTRAAITRIPELFSPTINWDDVKRLRERWPRKLVVKGILNVEDADRAAEIGCDGIVLSNHGGRHLDSCISPIEILPAVAAAVGHRLSIIVDGGFRRGSDVVKAIALGAHAVMVGRSVLYGIAAGGEAGGRHAIRLLNSEIHRVLGQIGCNSLQEASQEFVTYDWPGRLPSAAGQRISRNVSEQGEAR